MAYAPSLSSLPQASDALPPDAALSSTPVVVTLWEAGKARAVEAFSGESLMAALK